MTCTTTYSPPATVNAANADYSPGYGPFTTGTSALSVDPSGNLNTRGPVHTDEGGYRANFANSSLSAAIGTCVFTNGLATVSGTFSSITDVHLGDYVYLDADGSSYAVQVDYITSTEIGLVSAYTGVGGTGASSRQILNGKVGSGGSISVSSGQCRIVSGTTNSSIQELERDVDYLPLMKQGRFALNARQNNQDWYYGFYDENNGGAAKWYYWFRFTGTDDTKVTIECAWNPTTAPSGGEISTTIVSIPNNGRTSGVHRYRVELLKDRCSFFIDNVVVYQEYNVVPHPHDIQTSTLRCVNGTGVASSATCVLDFDMVANFDAVSIDMGSQTSNILTGTTEAPARSTVDDGAVLVEILNTLRQIANPVTMEVSSGRTRVVLDATGGAQTLGTVTTVATVTSMSQIAGIAANSVVYDTMHNAYSNTVRAQVL